MSDIRKKLYEVIFKADTPAGKAFDVVLLLAISNAIVCLNLKYLEFSLIAQN